MADSMKGVMKLRAIEDMGYSLARMADGGKPGTLKDLAEQIEREHMEELNVYREQEAKLLHRIERLEAKRGLSDGAQRAAERLGAVEDDGDMAVDYRKVYDCIVGHEPDPSGAGNYELRECIIDLIEHGGKQDVDVSALRELADELDAKIRASYRRECLSPRYNDGMRRGIGDAPERIRKAVEGAPKSGTVCECETHMQDDNSCVGECSLCERNGMVEWVEERGGLEAVQERIDSFARMLNSVDSVVCGDEQHCFGARVDLGEADELFGAIYGELDKRLMPPGVEWPRFEDGERVSFGSAADGLDGPCEKFIFTRSMGGVCQLQDADGRMVNVLSGERIKRPELEVLGADGEPIKVGETVYDGTGNRHVVVEVDTDRALVEFDGEPKRGWRASFITHIPPDTQERIDEDVKLLPKQYCDKYCKEIDEPFFDDGTDYQLTMMLDLMLRQRELDAKTMGGSL